MYETDHNYNLNLLKKSNNFQSIYTRFCLKFHQNLCQRNQRSYQEKGNVNNKYIYILLSLLLFMFLFNITWSVPISMLAKVFTINEYHIFNNLFVLLSIGLSVIYGCILYVAHNKAPKLYLWMMGLVYFTIILATLYPFVFPYSYGFFQENVMLSPKDSLLGFNAWYYLLDIILIVIAGTLAYFTVTSSSQFTLVVLLLFYMFENINTISRIKINTLDTTTNALDITMSLNHPNFIVYVQDAVGSIDMTYGFTNIWTSKEKEWTKGFTFFNNVFQFANTTLISMPSLLGGYEYTTQKHIETITENNITTWSERANKLIYLRNTDPNPYYFFWDEGISNLNTILNDQVTVKYYNIHQTEIKQYSQKRSSDKETSVFLKSPVLAVSLYARTPYFLRFLFSKNTGWGWRNKTFFEYRWVKLSSDSFRLAFRDTEKPVLNILHSWGIHLPLYPQAVEGGSLKDMYTALNYSLKSIQNIIESLKQHNIYDTTKIMITSDHGGTFPDRSPLMRSYFMVKDFSSAIDTPLKFDNRVLALPDAHAIMVSSFTNLANYPDYLKTIPPRRIFNIPLVSWQYAMYFMDKEKSTKYLRDRFNDFTKNNNGKIPYLRIDTGDLSTAQTNYYPLERIGDLSPYEIID